jgi:hypothetical protein
MRYRHEISSEAQRAFFLSPTAMAVFRDLLDNDIHLIRKLESELQG